MRPRTFTVPAGGAIDEKFIGLDANYIRLETTSPEEIIFKTDANDEVHLKSGEDAILSSFKSIQISQTSAADIIIILYVGRDTRKGSAQISGAVTVINPAPTVPWSNVTGFSNSGYLGNQVTTTFGTYTVPANKKAKIALIDMSLKRAANATTPSEARVEAFLYPVSGVPAYLRLEGMRFTANDLNVHHTLTLTPDIIMMPGDSVSFETYDDSTDGSQLYRGTIVVNEYDL
jgi:hypothetical protein